MSDTISRSTDAPAGVLVDLDAHRATRPADPAPEDAIPAGYAPTVPAQPAPAPAPVAPVVDEDDEVIPPLLPAWLRTAEGRRAARRRHMRRARRGMRRWAGRQRTERGHLAQIGRGTRRAHEWVIGVEGVHVQAAKHAAHAATREAREAARRARWTVMPKQREASRIHSERLQTSAMSTLATYRQARKDQRRGRLLRAALIWGTPAAVALTGWATEGVLGGLCGLCLDLAVFAFAGRKPLTAERWDPERRSIADGDGLNETMLDRALTAAKVITEGQQLRLVSPVIADGEYAWSVLFDLPEGIPATKVRERELELAAALGVDRSHLDIRQAGAAGRVSLWVSAIDPLRATRRSPLLDMREPLNTWKQGIPIAFNKRGELVYVTISDYSLIFAGATRSGKGMGLANLLVGAMLDPRVHVRLFDGKGSGEYVPLAPVLATFVRRNPRRLVEFLRVLVGEMERRTEILVELGLSKLTEELIDQVGGIELVVVDELATYTASEGMSKEYADEISELLAQIGAVGAAVGIVLALATQYPEVGIVKARLRGNCAGRMAMRTESADASNVILGKGQAGLGYDSSNIPNEKWARGRAWLTTPDTGMIEVRSLFIDESKGELPQASAIGIELRRAAGTLPGHCEDPVEAALTRVTGASSVAGGVRGNGGIARGTVLDHLVTAATDLGRGSITNSEVFEALADVDPDRFARAEGESDGAWTSRCGKALKGQLALLGVELESTRVTAADGTRPGGYTLEALKQAATDARNARK